MRVQMLLKVRRHGEATLADRALEWFLSSMGAIMQDKRVAVFESFEASLAREEFVVVGMCSVQMISSFFLRSELLVTFLALDPHLAFMLILMRCVFLK